MASSACVRSAYALSSFFLRSANNLARTSGASARCRPSAVELLFQLPAGLQGPSLELRGLRRQVKINHRDAEHDQAIAWSMFTAENTFFCLRASGL